MTSMNGFIFPFATMSPTLLDATAIIRLPVEGEELPTLFKLSIGELGIQFSKSSASYLAFLAANAKKKGLVFNGEHHAFLFYWLCKYFICTNSVAIIFEYSYYVAVIVSSKPITLTPLFLTLLYRSFFLILDQLKSDEGIKTVLGPLVVPFVVDIPIFP